MLHHHSYVFLNNRDYSKRIQRVFAILVMLILLGVFAPCAEAADVIRAHPIYEADEPPLPANIQAARRQDWKIVSPGLHAAVGSIDERYPRSAVPKTDGVNQWSGAAWRGERISLQLILWTKTPQTQVRLSAGSLRAKDGKEISASRVTLRFVRYVLADHGYENKPWLVPDVLDTAERLDMAGETVRPVWISIDVPESAAAGRYQGEIQIKAVGQKTQTITLNLEVQPAVLPPPSQWAFRLDLWQDPWSVAQFHGVPLWSDAHMAVLRPHLRMLADAGQKYITTYATPITFNDSTYVNNETMIEWTRGRDGKFRYDFTVWDRYVDLAMSCGIKDSITCYSMLPTDKRCCWKDEETGEIAWKKIQPGSDEFNDIWTQFLTEFVRHLRKRGLFERTYMGINESPVPDAKASIELMKKVAPGMKVTWAGDYHEELKGNIDDWSLMIKRQGTKEMITERTRQGRTTTFYTACGPKRPNNFSYSAPADSAWMGWFAMSQGYQGFLRWAYANWNENPLLDTRYIRWPSGDCFLVYPGPRSSIRFERLREGIADYEKIRIVRAMLQKKNDEESKKMLMRLDDVLSQFSYKAAWRRPTAGPVLQGRKLLVEITKKLLATDMQ